MISTVTMVSTVTTVAALGISTIINVIAVIALLVFLLTRELAGTSNSRRTLRIALYASIGTLPLIVAFAVIVMVKIIELL